MSRDELLRELAYKRYIEDPDGPVVLSRELADEILNHTDEIPHGEFEPREYSDY